MPGCISSLFFKWLCSTFYSIEWKIISYSHCSICSWEDCTYDVRPNALLYLALPVTSTRILLMPKTKKRKLPISNPLDNYVATSRPQSSRSVIRRFHVLIKKEAQLKCNRSPSAAEIEDLVKIQHEIQELGGLQRYQRMSTVGQSGDRGGGSEKVFIEWMKELKLHVSEMQIKLRCAPPNLSVDNTLIEPRSSDS